MQNINFIWYGDPIGDSAVGKESAFKGVCDLYSAVKKDEVERIFNYWCERQFKLQVIEAFKSRLGDADYNDINIYTTEDLLQKFKSEENIDEINIRRYKFLLNFFTNMNMFNFGKELLCPIIQYLYGGYFFDTSIIIDSHQKIHLPDSPLPLLGKNLLFSYDVWAFYSPIAKHDLFKTYLRVVAQRYWHEFTRIYDFDVKNNLKDTILKDFDSVDLEFNITACVTNKNNYVAHVAADNIILHSLEMVSDKFSHGVISKGMRREEKIINRNGLFIGDKETGISKNIVSTWSHNMNRPGEIKFIIDESFFPFYKESWELLSVDNFLYFLRDYYFTEDSYVEYILPKFNRILNENSDNFDLTSNILGIALLHNFKEVVVQVIELLVSKGLKFDDELNNFTGVLSSDVIYTILHLAKEPFLFNHLYHNMLRGNFESFNQFLRVFENIKTANDLHMVSYILRVYLIPLLNLALYKGYVSIIKQINNHIKGLRLTPEFVTAFLAAKYTDGEPGLLVAIKKGHVEAIKSHIYAILKSGLSCKVIKELLESKNATGVPCLHLAFRNGNFNVIQAYFEAVTFDLLSDSQTNKVLSSDDVTSLLLAMDRCGEPGFKVALDHGHYETVKSFFNLISGFSLIDSVCIISAKHEGFPLLYCYLSSNKAEEIVRYCRVVINSLLSDDVKEELLLAKNPQKITGFLRSLVKVNESAAKVYFDLIADSTLLFASKLKLLRSPLNKSDDTHAKNLYKRIVVTSGLPGDIKAEFLADTNESYQPLTPRFRRYTV